MDATNIIGALAIVSAIVFGVIASRCILALIGDWKRVSWAHQSAGMGSGVAMVLVGGFRPLLGISSRLLRLSFVRVFLAKALEALKLTGVKGSLESICSMLVLACVILIALGAALGSWLAGAAFGICLIAGVSAWSSHVLEVHREAIRDDLPEAIRAMSACFHAGFSLQQTFAQLRDELTGPVSDLFGRAGDAMETGSSAREALDLIRSSQNVPELSFIAVALDVQHRCGGSLRHVLDAACESLESEMELRRSLRVHTAQARLSARVVTGVTVALVGVLSLLTDDFLGPFFSSAAGMAMLACALVMQCVGVLVIRRMLRVEVA